MIQEQNKKNKEESVFIFFFLLYHTIFNTYLFNLID